LPSAAVCLPAGAAGEQILNATYNSPALCTNVGETLDLAKCKVQFDDKSAAVSGDKLTWTDAEGHAVSALITPDKAGVTAIKASDGTRTRTVYVVAKNQSDSDWVLFESDGDFAYKTVQQTSGAKISANEQDKTLVLNASNSGDAYIRVLVAADILADFADYVVESKVKLSGATADSRWGSLMYRVQNKDYPYMHFCMRYNSTLSNGCELAERTSGNAWNVIKKSAASQKKDQFAAMKVDVCGADAVYYLDGAKILSYDATPYSAGDIGFQVRGVTMTVGGIKVTVNKNSDFSDNKQTYAVPAEVETKLSCAPFSATDVATTLQYSELATTLPAVAVFRYVGDTGKTDESRAAKLQIMQTGALKYQYVKIADIMTELDGKIIPAFRVSGSADAAVLANELKENNIKDAYVISDDVSVLKKLRSVWKYANTVWDMSGNASDNLFDIEKVRISAVENGIRSIILPLNHLNYDSVEYLQDRYICVWGTTDDTTEKNVRAVNCGVTAILSQDVSLLKDNLKTYYTEANTLTSMPNIIGHRGVPSLAQENSLAGCIKAYSLGADMVENDIYLSKDGVLVVMHDTTIDRTTNGSGTVTAMTSAQLSKYQIDINSSVPTEPIPTLEDYFKEVKDKGKTVVIELKSSNLGVAKPLAETVKKYDILNQIVVISFYPEVITEVRKYLPGVSGAYLNSSISPTESSYQDVMEILMEELQTSSTVYSPSYASGALGPNLITALRLRGIGTWGWTFNKQADFDRYFVMGIRGITTNYSQWASGYAKRLTFEEGKLFVETYDGTKKELSLTNSKVKEVIVNENGNGEVTKFYTYTARTTSGTSYTIVSEPVLMKDGKTVETELVAEDTTLVTEAGTEAAEAATEAAAEGSTETAQSDDTSAEGTEAENASGKKSGCGASLALALPFVWGVVCFSAFVLRKKKHE